MQRVKKIWNASGNLQATSRGAKEKPRVSQLEIEKPVMQFAIWMMTNFPITWSTDAVHKMGRRYWYLWTASCWSLLALHVDERLASISMWGFFGKSHSQTPAVEVFIPVPRPATIRPTII
jgi:hypothetical protein